MTEPDLVLAAGGLVFRSDRDRPELVLVHRPKYDDWSIPKGKLDPGEAFEVAACREVEEETGCRCELGPELTSVRYVDDKGRPKLVRYWLMTLDREGDFTPNDEVDELRWVSWREAVDLVTHDTDRHVLAAFGRSIADATTERP